MLDQLAEPSWTDSESASANQTFRAFSAQQDPDLLQPALKEGDRMHIHRTESMNSVPPRSGELKIYSQPQSNNLTNAEPTSRLSQAISAKSS